MGIEENIKAANANKFNIVCGEFKKFVNKYVDNRPEYVELKNLLIERPLKDPI
jgi:hypothetical protein